MASSSSSPRVIGRGRVIGKPSQQPAIPVPDYLKSQNVVSPSASSMSLDSQVSQDKSSTDDTDISTAVTLQSSSSVPASAGNRMICPICNEVMVTLLQLNRHLDDAHKNLEDEEQDEVKTWFKTQMLKAKKFQPLAVLNQKLKGMDVFEANEDKRLPSTQSASQTSTATVAAATARSSSPAAAPAPKVIDTDEMVTREHWQRYTRTGECSDPLCGRRLGASNGNVNCRKCGKLFCEEHTMYQMKLSRSAQHEPVRGYWCRVCETCYKSREGYNDHTGLEREHMKDFAAVRRKVVDKQCLDVSRLEKRLTRLTQLMVDPQLEQDEGVSSYLWSVAGYKNSRRAAEESVVEWEEDAKVAHCPYCQQEFTSYGFRRHHCRLCGKVVCGDVETKCSVSVPLDVAARTLSYPTSLDACSLRRTAPQNSSEKAARVPVDVRMCKDCHHTVFSRADFDRAAAQVPADQRAFQNLKQFERGIRVMLPRFQKLLTALQDPDKPPSPAQLAEATKVRKRLTDSFTQYDVAARRIRDTPTESATQQRLQRQVYLSASSFLHVHMLPLKALPKILKHASPHGRSPSSSSFTGANGHLSPHPRDRGPLAAIKRDTASADASSQPSQSSRLSGLEAEEKQLREELAVLEEQKFMVSEMVADAQRRRKFGEVESLQRNALDLDKEIDRVQGTLANVGNEFRNLYAAEHIPNGG